MRGYRDAFSDEEERGGSGSEERSNAYEAPLTGVAAFLGHRAGRSISSHFFSMGSLAVSTIFTVVAICIPAHSYGEVSAKVGLPSKGLH